MSSQDHSLSPLTHVVLEVSVVWGNRVGCHEMKVNVGFLNFSQTSVKACIWGWTKNQVNFYFLPKEVTQS